MDSVSGSRYSVAFSIFFFLLTVPTKANALDSRSWSGRSTGECEYLHFSESHTMCLPPNEDCDFTIIAFNDDRIKEILDLHNSYRQQVARGYERLGRPGPQPPAANMMELVWNAELAAVAQAWANQCVANHDQYKNRQINHRNYPVGQNKYRRTTTKIETTDQLLNRTVSSFYKEVKDFNHSQVEKFKGAYVNGYIVGHYTQMIWATTEEIGCGAIVRDCLYKHVKPAKCTTVVCNYGPTGNVIGRNMYLEGDPASSCPAGESDVYEGLCKPDIEERKI